METPLEKVSVKSCFAHSRSGVPIEEWQTLQDHSKAVARHNVGYIALVTNLSPNSPCLVTFLESHDHFLLSRYSIPFFVSSLFMKYIIAPCPAVCYNARCHGTEKVLLTGLLKSCELKHKQGRSNSIIAHS